MCGQLCVSLMDVLRYKGPEQRLTLEFQHDVYKCLFHGKGRTAEEKNWSSFYENDFCRCRLPTINWNSIYDKHGDGVKIRFPLKLRTFFQLSPRTYKRVGETIVEALLGVNFDKRHGFETATREPRTGDERQTTPAK